MWCGRCKYKYLGFRASTSSFNVMSSPSPFSSASTENVFSSMGSVGCRKDTFGNKLLETWISDFTGVEQTSKLFTVNE